MNGCGSVASIKRHLLDKSDFDWICLCQFGNGCNLIGVDTLLHHCIDFERYATFNNPLEGFHDSIEVIPPSDLNKPFSSESIQT